ncbi:hypothetical protein J1N35_042994 [Gossypium stocksii]|uniref:Uncharacterized protein n=1 Tax=Gossypium stocksii TaxID=47602 RepID=A0A9D3U6H1_9ROSI|nr:hypothetical protein J1N35_042994 [Gossypium stocksii]
MAWPGTSSDEPLTPVGRLLSQPLTNIVIHWIVRLENHVEHWRKTQIDIDRHVVVINNRLHKAGDENTEEDDDDDEAAVNQCVADLIDDALGDGVYLRSMLMAICRRKDDADAHPRMVNDKSLVIKGVKGRDLFWLFGALWGLLKAVVFTLLFSVEFVCRSLLVSDEKTAITGGDGVELWPRKLATAKFLLDDINVVKKAVPNSVSDRWLLRFSRIGFLY